MANELKFTFGLQYANGNASDAVTNHQLLVNQSLQEELAGIVSVPTADTAVSFTGLTTPGWMWMKNLDATNYVQYGPTNAGALTPFGRILPGEEAMLRFDPGLALRWKANAAPVKIQYQFYGN